MDFGASLERILANRSMRPAELCRLTGISSGLMSNYVKGAKVPTLTNAVLIADALGISIDELCGRNPPDSAAKRELLANFNQLNDEGKEAAINMISGMLSVPAYKKSYRPVVGEEKMAV